MNTDTIYVDHVSASPVLEEAAQEMVAALRDGFGNPHSVHRHGQRAAELLERGRTRVAALVGADPEDVIFTSTGSEANNLAVKGIVRARRKRSTRVITSAIEHLSVLGAAKSLAKEGFEIISLPVDGNGLVSRADLEAALKKGAALVTIMHANTEIGTIEPVSDLAAACGEAGVPMHTDAWGTAGQIPVDFKALAVDAMTVAGQNFGGPPGAAALVLRRGVPMRSIVDGGVQERNLRAGQENLPAIAGMGVAAEIAAVELKERTGRLEAIRDALLSRLPAEIDDAIVTGHPKNRLPGHASFCVKYIEGEGLLLFLDQKGISAASGSTCAQKSLKGSHTLEAIGLDAATAQGSIVFTLGPGNSEDEIDRIISSMKPIVARLREMSPLYQRKDNGNVQ